MLRLSSALVYMILWYIDNAMDVVNVMFYLPIIFDATNEFFPVDTEDFLKWLVLNHHYY